MVQTKTRRLYHSIYGMDLGLTLNKPTTIIDVKATPKCRNVLFEYGHVSPTPGYTLLTGTQPLYGTVMAFNYWTKQDNVSSMLMVHTTTDVYKYTSDEFTLLTENAVVENCEDVWATSANVTCATDTDKKVGTYSVKLTIAAGFTTGVIAYEDFSSADLTGYDTIRFWFKSSKTLAAGDIQILLDDTSGCVSPKESLNLPAITADTWTYVSIDLADPTALAAIISVGLKAPSTDPGEVVFHIDDVKVFKTFSGDADDMVSAVVMGDLYMWTQGTSDNVKMWNMSDSAVSTLTGTTNYKCKSLAKLGQRVCMYNLTDTGTDKPQRVRWCIVGDPTDWSAGGSGYRDLTTSIGTDFILTALPLGNYVALYGKKTVALQEYIGGATIFDFHRRVSGKGAINGRCVVDVGGEHAVLGVDDVSTYSGGRTLDSIGTNVMPNVITNIEASQYDKCFLEYIRERKELHIHMPTIGESVVDLDYMLSITHKNWTNIDRAFTGFGSYIVTSAVKIGNLVGSIGEQNWKFGDSVMSAKKDIPLYGDTSGYVYKLDTATYNNNGVLVDQYVDTKDFVIGERYKARMGEWMELNFEAKGISVDIYYSTDTGDTYTLLETVTLTDSWERYSIDFDVNNPQLRFRFRNNTLSSAFFLGAWIEIGYIEGSEVF